MTEAERQKITRDRRKAKMERMQSALSEIITLTAGKTGDAAVAIRTLAEGALSNG